ncbi:acyltransferase family protein [Roseateles sp. DC23W]|uniref:Acyltransferase family protein n=1 Tax=Pelomonas dachongensis TaxID=3299029 RepID=A0ABW7EUC4_9BURK
MSATQKTARYEGLEGLRALMAIWVVFGHVGNFLGFYLGVNAPAWMKLVLLTSVPVNVFIALSGFVVFEMIRRRPVNYPQYIRSRAARIFPIYFFALVLALLLNEFRLEVLQSQPWRSLAELAFISQRASDVRVDYAAHVAAHALMIHGLVPEALLPHAAQALLAPAWSLSLEWQFYLLAPAIYAGVTRQWWGVFGVAAVFAGTQILGQHLLPSLTNAAIINSWGYFFVGWACSRFLAAISDGKDLYKSLSWMIFLVALGAVSTLFGASDARATVFSLCIWMAAFWAACCPAVRIAAWRSLQVKINGFLSVGWLRRIGDSSYSLYLLHVFVLDAIGWLLIRQGYLNMGVVGNYLLLLGLVLPLSVLAAMIGYKCIERPFMALGRARATVGSRWKMM